MLRQPIDITGCGRTDAGVHARWYIAHFDADISESPAKVLYQVNAILPHDIALYRLEEASPDFHARFDAVSRTYRYYLHFEKNPFLHGQSFYFHYRQQLHEEALHEAAALLLQYQHFKPFCKTGTDANHYACELMISQWQLGKDNAMYTITANRFLRGMVRLVVGACLNAGLGKISIADLRHALEQQTTVPHAWSVPPEGLFLEDVLYNN